MSNLRLAVGFVVLCLLAPCQAQRQTFDGKTVLFGNLHAHSTLSDDTSMSDAERTPLKAFTYAHDHGLDFLGITDHYKADDSINRLSLTPAEYKTELFDVAMQFNLDHPGEFIAIPGIEWGTTATGNHLGIYGSTTLPPDSIKDKDYKKLYDWAATNAKFLQCNHPYSWNWKSNRNKAVGNFAEKQFPSLSDFVSTVGPQLGTMSVICSVHGGHISGKFRDSEEKIHRDIHRDHFGVFTEFLNKGFQLSPAANQDTHGKNWGTVTAARTAVWADSVAYDGLIEGLQNNCVYATEDDELAIGFQAHVDGKRYWMGETVPMASSQAAVTKSFTDVPANADFTIPLNAVNGEYCFLQVTEQNGKDNPVGNGEDEIDNATGDEAADGKRDDMNDSAWTTAIWFNSSNADFVWSKNSALYHDHDCWVVPFIGATNRRSGPTKPTGHTKHNCQLHNPFE